MNSIDTVVRIGDEMYSAFLGSITSTHLGYEDHGFLVAAITIESEGGSGVTFGHHVLGSQADEWPYEDRAKVAYLRLWFDKILDVTGRSRWEDVRGASVYALFPQESILGSRVVGICSLSGKTAFIPTEFDLE